MAIGVSTSLIDASTHHRARRRSAELARGIRGWTRVPVRQARCSRSAGRANHERSPRTLGDSWAGGEVAAAAFFSYWGRADVASGRSAAWASGMRYTLRHATPAAMSRNCFMVTSRSLMDAVAHRTARSVRVCYALPQALCEITRLNTPSSASPIVPARILERLEVGGPSCAASTDLFRVARRGLPAR